MDPPVLVSRIENVAQVRGGPPSRPRNRQTNAGPANERYRDRAGARVLAHRLLYGILGTGFVGEIVTTG